MLYKYGKRTHDLLFFKFSCFIFGLIKQLFHSPLLDMRLCSSRKHPYSPHRRDWNFLGDGGFWKIKKYKEMYEALLEFPEVWGGVRKNPFRGGGMDIFWNYTLL